jgi:hypothetical protein
MEALVKQVSQLLSEGVYDPNKLFELVYPKSQKHYATVRRAIHIAKVK